MTEQASVNHQPGLDSKTFVFLNFKAALENSIQSLAFNLPDLDSD